MIERAALVDLICSSASPCVTVYGMRAWWVSSTLALLVGCHDPRETSERFQQAIVITTMRYSSEPASEFFGVVDDVQTPGMQVGVGS